MKPRYQILLLLVVAACVFFAGLGRLPLVEPDEGRNAEVAREMLVLHDWVTPHFDTLVYLDKPAAFFWLVAGSLRLFGVSEWASRLPSALAALGTLLLVCVLARRMFGDAAGITSGLVFATSPLVMVFARLVIFDMTLAFLVTLSLVAFWLAQASAGKRRIFESVMFAAAGVATITKGPVGLLLPLLSILLFTWLQRRMADLKRIAWLPGIALFLAVSLPWFIAVSIRNPDFPRYAFWDESLLRFATGHAHRGGSVFYYIPVFLVGFLPWSFALSFAGLNRLKGWRRLRDGNHAAEAFLFSWAVTVFVLFSISRSKLPAYFLPAIPALAILMGRIWTQDVGRDPARPRPDWLTAGYAMLIALGLLLAVAPAWMQVASLHKLAVKRIHPSVLDLLSSSIFYSGLILVALGILGRNLAGRPHRRFYAVKCLAVFAVSMPLLALRWWPTIETWATTSSARSLARAIHQEPEGGLPIYGYFYFRPSLPFYLQSPVGLVTSDGGELTSNYIVAHRRAISGEPSLKMIAPDGKTLPLILSGSEFTTLGRSPPTSFLVVVRNDEVPDVAKIHDLGSFWQAWEYSVWAISAGNSSP